MSNGASAVVARIPELGAAWQRAMGDIEKVQRVIGEADDSLAALRSQLSALDHQIRQIKSGTVDSIGGVQLLDKQHLQGIVLPPGTPVLDVRLSAQTLERKIFSDAPFLTRETDFDQFVSEPIHRDVARFVGFPVVRGSASERGDLVGSVVRQVGNVSGFGTPDEAAYHAMREAVNVNRSVVVMPGSTDAGESRYLLGMLDNVTSSTTHFSDAGEIAPLSYRLESGDTPMAFGIASPDGGWRDLTATKPVQVDPIINSAVKPLDELNGSTIVNYDPAAVEQIKGLEQTKAQIEELVKVLQGNASRLNESVQSALLESRGASSGALPKHPVGIVSSVTEDEILARALGTDAEYKKLISTFSGVLASKGLVSSLDDLILVARHKGLTPEELQILVAAFKQRIENATRVGKGRSPEAVSLEVGLMREVIESDRFAPSAYANFSLLTETFPRYKDGKIASVTSYHKWTPTGRHTVGPNTFSAASIDGARLLLRTNSDFIEGYHGFDEAGRVASLNRGNSYTRINDAKLNQLINDRFLSDRNEVSALSMRHAVLNSGRSSADVERILGLFGTTSMKHGAQPAVAALDSGLTVGEIAAIADRSGTVDSFGPESISRFTDELKTAISGKRHTVVGDSVG